jgi:hypothetical protein
MKKSILLCALGLLMSLGAFAAPKSHHPKNMDMGRQMVSLIPLKHSRGFAIMVDKQMPAKSMVVISDEYGNTVFKDCLTQGATAEKKYVLDPNLVDGKYVVEVYTQGHDIQTNFYIYHRGNRRIVDIM